MMNNKTYDVLKWVAQYLLPALATLYFAIAQVWGCLTANRLWVRLRSIRSLGISTAQYNKALNSEKEVNLGPCNIALGDIPYKLRNPQITLDAIITWTLFFLF